MRLAPALGLLLLAACSDRPDDAPTAVEVTASAVPPDLVGRWRLSREVCEAGSDGKPASRLPDTMLTLHDDFTYDMTIAGWPSRGTFRIEATSDGPRVQMTDTLLNFDLVDGTLQNWGEGEAVYVCGNVFTREGNS